METIALLITGIVVCITIIILCLKHFGYMGFKLSLILLIVTIILFINLNDKWKEYKRYEGTTIENCSDLLNIERFPTDENTGILMFTIDSTLQDEVEAKINLKNGKSYSAKSVGGIFGIVLPVVTGELENIEFNYGPGLINNAHFNSYSYTSVTFNSDFEIESGKLTYLGHITRELNEYPDNDFLNEPFNLFERVDNTYLYRIMPTSNESNVNEILKVWEQLNRLNDFYSNLKHEIFDIY